VIQRAVVKDRGFGHITNPRFFDKVKDVFSGG
jgi:hypothetical protein